MINILYYLLFILFNTNNSFFITQLFIYLIYYLFNIYLFIYYSIIYLLFNYLFIYLWKSTPNIIYELFNLFFF